MSKAINVLTYLEKSVEKYPNKIAFLDEKETITYKELMHQAQKLASYLLISAKKNQPIAILSEKSVHTIIAMFASIYAGCFYVMINPDLPIERINKIIATLENPLILVEEKYSNLDIHSNTKKIIEKNYNDINIDEKRLLEVRDTHIDIDPLYCMFTSGSTGEPKGILVSHRSVIDFIDIFKETFNFSETDVFGNQAPFDFDVSIKDIYTTIKCGASMVMIPKQKFSFPNLLLDYLIDNNITTLVWAVSALTIIPVYNAFTYKVPTKINKVLFSGEVMPVKHLNEWKKHVPNADYVNLYGPTEITCNCTYYKIPKGIYQNDVLPIGKAFKNERVVLINEDGIICKPNIQGEICVSGTALSLGYYGRKTDTNNVFIQNPFNDKYLEMFYKTGDIGYYDEAMNLYFSSRKDFQIKHMGHRIELTEIDKSILEIESISKVATLYQKDNGHLIAFVQGNIGKGQLIMKLKDKLPKFMIPNKIYFLDHLPLTLNGKIDRKALMEVYQNDISRSV